MPQAVPVGIKYTEEYFCQRIKHTYVSIYKVQKPFLLSLSPSIDFSGMELQRMFAETHVLVLEKKQN